MYFIFRVVWRLVHILVLSLFSACFLGQDTQFSVKVEGSSPGGVPQVGEDADTSPSKLSKEELIQSMDRVDREIAKVEQQIFKLKKKQVCSLNTDAWERDLNTAPAQ